VPGNCPADMKKSSAWNKGNSQAVAKGNRGVGAGGEKDMQIEKEQTSGYSCNFNHSR
jgi:hypothetical protein